MKIIGHRGAAGLAAENTLRSIKAAQDAGVDAIELDVRATRDEQLIVCHDASLERTFDHQRRVSKITARQALSLVSPDGDRLPTLETALQACDGTPVYIEGKSTHWARPLAALIRRRADTGNLVVISFNHHELAGFRKLCPGVPTYVLEHRNSFDAINAARIYGFDGIDINYWTLNPLVYWLARRHHLKIAVFTVNKPWVASFLRILYPGISLTTDYPNKMQFLRPKALRVNTARK